MRVDHITALLALLLENLFRSVAIGLICKPYTPEDASYILSQWEQPIQFPPSHPLAELDLARNRILAMLQVAYTNPEPSTRDPRALTDLVFVAIPVETFNIFTAVTL